MSAPVFVVTPGTAEPAGSSARQEASAAPSPSGSQPGSGTRLVLSSLDSGDEIVLTGPEAHHAVSVRRLREPERVDLVDGAGLRLVCTVTSAGGGARDRLGVRVVERVVEPAPPVRLVLVQALAKGGRDEQAVETATEVGAETLLPWQARRCVSVWQGARRSRGQERWQATAREAAKQARRAVVPRVEEVRSTDELAQWVRATVEAGGVVGLLHEEARAPLSALLPALAGPGAVLTASQRPVLAVIVGPEGGIEGEEVTTLEKAGAVTVRLGPHVMRTASAGPVALAVLAQHAGLWEPAGAFPAEVAR
ncbi:16S rRNA (uracil(1498)-N(3))-methyltransferase [Actinomyces sp. 2119]|uniref:16S rRNA (uracil(1498)-N(3))-methyltransferase n=1 Tax=Actinomyces sp. 2119 TaxID=2321393 RepID=UPI000E6CBF6A|nr:16S rRNA (uracil(1498)-N(3))-methyltransferase [Actinomyces sp. 2119]RJF42423.1 16S rRNA (uracil(1498)-N(3))-methyltransferase [Actinomyces sp. 2119]